MEKSGEQIDSSVWKGVGSLAQWSAFDSGNPNGARRKLTLENVSLLLETNIVCQSPANRPPGPWTLTREVSLHQSGDWWPHILHLTTSLSPAWESGSMSAVLCWDSSCPWIGTRREPPLRPCGLWCPVSVSGPESTTLLFLSVPGAINPFSFLSTNCQTVLLIKN